MSKQFVTSGTEFPKTPHIVWLGDQDKLKDDKLLDSKEVTKLIASPVIIQEKVDGNCVGFSYTRAAEPVMTHRGGQISANDFNFKGLHAWYKQHEDAIFDLCGSRYTLFGEWLYWHHTIPYTRLPSLFLAHDMYDREKQVFLPTRKVAAHTRAHGIAHNPVIYQGTINSIDDLLAIHNLPSQFGEFNREGIYVRVDTPQANAMRAKIVSREFHDVVENSTHWRDRNQRLQNKSTAKDEQSYFMDKKQNRF